jgi:prepilin-type N-terminal cleavage/methylation domain-containing protein
MTVLQAKRAAGRDERGFTLIELLVVMIIIAVLVVIAVPSLLGFKDRAQERTAAANVRSAIPAAEAYYSNNNSYAGMDLPALQAIDHVDPNLTVVADAANYCLSDTQGPHVAKVVGPGGTIDQNAAGTCTSSTG